MFARSLALGLALSSLAALPLGSHAANPLGRYADEMPLDGDLAFRTSMMSGRDGSVLVRWEMPAGYYLYRNKLSIAGTNGLLVSRVAAPAGQVKDDPFLGRVEIYRDAVTVVVDRKTAAGGNLVVKYQGCAEDKVCYPPMTRTFAIPPASTCQRGRQGTRQQGAC